MDMLSFIIGFVSAAILMFAGFIIWNFNSPDGVDEAEAEIRKKTPDYKEAVAKGKEKLKRKLLS